MKPVCLEWPFNLVFIQATMKSGLVGCRRLNATRLHIHIMLISKFGANDSVPLPGRTASGVNLSGPFFQTNKPVGGGARHCGNIPASCVSCFVTQVSEYLPNHHRVFSAIAPGIGPVQGRHDAGGRRPGARNDEIGRARPWLRHVRKFTPQVGHGHDPSGRPPARRDRRYRQRT